MLQYNKNQLPHQSENNTSQHEVPARATSDTNELTMQAPNINMNLHKRPICSCQVSNALQIP